MQMTVIGVQPLLVVLEDVVDGLGDLDLVACGSYRIFQLSISFHPFFFLSFSFHLFRSFLRRPFRLLRGLLLLFFGFPGCPFLFYSFLYRFFDLFQPLLYPRAQNGSSLILFSSFQLSPPVWQTPHPLHGDRGPVHQDVVGHLGLLQERGVMSGDSPQTMQHHDLINGLGVEGCHLLECLRVVEEHSHVLVGVQQKHGHVPVLVQPEALEASLPVRPGVHLGEPELLQLVLLPFVHLPCPRKPDRGP
jgi:hypothetical protein